MTQNLETMIITSARSLNEAHRHSAQEIEKLRERLGSITLLIGLARKALADNRQAAADRYLGLAEKAARGSEHGK